MCLFVARKENGYVIGLHILVFEQPLSTLLGNQANEAYGHRNDDDGKPHGLRPQRHTIVAVGRVLGVNRALQVIPFALRVRAS